MSSICAYDLETTPIDAGTPSPLYITARSDKINISLEIGGENKIDSLRAILESYFLIPENNKIKFIAWNGNRYDAYFIIASILLSKKWIVHPYLTSSNALRGFRVVSVSRNRKGPLYSYEFLDGISMTGMVGVPLKKFLDTFAPDLPKLNLDLENTVFDPSNKDHVKYAERDSEGLYYGMLKVELIIKKLTEHEEINNKGKKIKVSEKLKPTIGNLSINFFMKRVPTGSKLFKPSDEIFEILHGPIKRGGYCWCMRQYQGKVWKYDINQAYAAAMRDEKLPCDYHSFTLFYNKNLPGIYECEIKRKIPTKIPFYYKTDDNKGRFTLGDSLVTCWLTSVEIDHLISDNWQVKILQGYYWSNYFDFSDVITQLETLRATDKDGPGGPLGTMVKAIGNNAYGKTLELLNNVDLVFSVDAPDGYDLYDPIDEDMFMIWSKKREEVPKKYHLPQIGAFITAHVRCKVRNTALIDPDNFLYADTDSVTFSRPVKLDIHPTRYGAWKIEENGTDYIIIGKKVYSGGKYKKAKGLHTSELDYDDYIRWMNGHVPEQKQLQRNNILKFLSGSDMFKSLKRKGTDVNNLLSTKLENGTYYPT